MAEQFIGTTVLVTLLTPPDTQLRGLVASIQGQVLTLKDVVFLSNGHTLPLYRVDATQIKELEVAPQSTTTAPLQSTPQASTYAPAPGLSHYHQIYANQSNPAPIGQPYYGGPLLSNVSTQPVARNVPLANRPAPSQPQDPAILSFGRKPETNTNGSSRPPPIPSELLPGGDLTSATSSRPAERISSVKPITISQSQFVDGTRIKEAATAGTLSSAVNNLNLDNADEFDDTDDVAASANAVNGGNPVQTDRNPQQQTTTPKKDGYTGKRSRRGKGRTPKEVTGTVDEAVPEGNGNTLGSSPLTTRKAKKKILQKDGWRQGAFTEAQEPEEQGGLQPGSNTRRGRHRRQLTAGEEQDGWATEEATDIHTMGDFDFAGNLSKFDKKTVFNQIRQDDTTADESRLVSYNRLPQAKPGTAGGKNLHHTENVLDGPNGLDSDMSDSDLDSAHQSGRSSRRAISRQSTLQMPSRKGSMAIGTGAPSLTKPALLATMNRAHHSSSHTASPRIGAHSHSASPLPGNVSSSRPSLRVVPSNRTCGVINPLQMLDIERIMETEIGLTEDMMTENAGRGMAEVALSVLNPGGKRIVKENHNTRPVVVVLAGSNRCGARALAAGRHLRNHGIQVIGCVLGLEREGEFLDSFKRQLHVFRKTHSRAVRLDELTETLASLNAPPELVIDGLLGMHDFEDLRVDDQATAYELIQWANKSKAPILAVDVPSGMDASTGEVTNLDSQPLHVRAKIIVSLGAPKIGILNACIAGDGHHWQLYVVDIGISNAAWKRYGTRRRYGVDFGSQWVVMLRYQGGVE